MTVPLNEFFTSIFLKAMLLILLPKEFSTKLSIVPLFPTSSSGAEFFIGSPKVWK